MSKIVLEQNVIGRIAHGLMGLDLFIQEGKENQYLEDFLSLEAQEINEALTSVSAGMRAHARLVPKTHGISLNETVDLIDKILQTQKIVKNVKKADKKEIDYAVESLKKATRLFFSVYHR